MRKLDSSVRGVLREADSRDRYWWHYPGLCRLNLLLVGCIVADVTQGYDGSMLNGLQSVDAWQTDMGSLTGTRLGTISNGAAVYCADAAAAGAAAADRGGSVVLLVGVALQAAAPGYSMFVVGRVLIGIGNGVQGAACPVLLAELSHPSQRAKMIGLMNSTGSLGQILAAWITYGAALHLGGSSWSWRLPSLLQAASSVFQLVMSFAVPESPCWLLRRGRRAEAHAILARYHAEGDADSVLLQHEVAEIEDALAAEQQQASTAWSEWLRTPANRYRLWIVISSGFIIQWCGNALLSYYIHLVFNSMGITNSFRQLELNGGLTLNGVVWGNLFSLCIDRFGRRPMWLVGLGGMFCSFLLLTVFTGVNTARDYADHALSRATLFAIFSFGFFYKLPGCMLPAYLSEIAPYELRAKAYVLSSLCDAAASIFSGYVNPIGLAAIGWRYYIVWCCMLGSHFCVVFFFYPETKKLSLEEVTQAFDGLSDGQQLATSRSRPDHSHDKSPDNASRKDLAQTEKDLGLSG